MRRPAVVAGVAAIALGLMAATAAAVPPQHSAQDPRARIVQDTGQACGFPVRWTIDLTVKGTNFSIPRDGSSASRRISVRTTRSRTSRPG
jgi:hypothetical protein